MLKFNFLEKIADKFNLGVSFLNKKNSPTVKNKNVLKNSAVGSIQQAQKIDNSIKNFASSEDHISDLEIKILRKLYSAYKETGKYPRLNLITLHKEIGIFEGDYIGILNDSRFLKVDGNDYVIKEAGIRFMDSFVRNNKPEIDIISFALFGGSCGQEITGMRLINNGVAAAIDIKCFISADGVKKINFANIERINPGEESRNSLSFRYFDTPFSKELLGNIKIFFEYKNKDGFNFSSGRLISQIKIADEDYSISNQKGDYFEL